MERCHGLVLVVVGCCRCCCCCCYCVVEYLIEYKNYNSFDLTRLTELTDFFSVDSGTVSTVDQPVGATINQQSTLIDTDILNTIAVRRARFLSEYISVI
jgi:hypothetical protein